MCRENTQVKFELCSGRINFGRVIPIGVRQFSIIVQFRLIIRNAFIFKNGNRRYKYLVLGHEETYFVKEHSDSKNKYSEDDIIKMLEFWLTIFSRKSLPADSWHSNGYELCPFLADIFLYSYAILCSQRERNSISVQSHLQVHRWCIVHKQPRIWKLSGPDVSCWTWDQGHYREHYIRFLPRFTTDDWEGSSTSHFPQLQTLLYWEVIFHLRLPMAFLSLSLYDTTGLLVWMFYSEDQATFQ